MSRADAALSREAAAAQAEGCRVPQSLLDDPIGRAWLAVHVIDHPTRGWESADVDFALEQAHELLRVIGGPVGPRGDRGNWPGVASAAVAQGRVTAAQVSFVEDVLTWLSRFVATAPEAGALRLWCACIERRQSFSGACKRLGRNANTEKTRRRRGALLIAAGLCRDDVPIPAHVIAARQARAGAERLSDIEAAIAEGSTVKAGEGATQALQEPASNPIPDAAGGADVSPELWDRVRAALRQRRPGASPNQLVNGLLIEQVKTEFSGQGLSKALVRDMETRRRQLRVLARREGLLDDGGPR